MASSPLNDDINSFGAKFVVCFFFKQTIAWKEVYIKVERLNVKQRRSR